MTPRRFTALLALATGLAAALPAAAQPGLHEALPDPLPAPEGRWNRTTDVQRTMAHIPLIPREILFGNPSRASVSYSPDGRHISWLAPVNGVLNVWVAPADDLDAARPITDDTGRGIRQYFWAYNGTHVVYLQDADGDENFHAFSVDVENGEQTELSPFPGARVQIEQTSRNFPDEIVLGINNRNPQLFDLHRVNVVTGERTLLRENPGFLGFTIDDDFRVRFAYQYAPDGSMNLFRIPGEEGGEPEPFDRIPFEDSMTTAIVGFDGSGEVIYTIDSRQGNTAALYTRDLRTGETALVFEDERADISGAMINPETKRIEAAASNYDRVRWTVLDSDIRRDFEALRRVRDGDFTVTSRTLADDKWIVAYTLSDAPAEYYSYDRATRTATYLFSNRPELEGQPLAPMRPVVIESRDGLDLVGYLTLPIPADRTRGDRPRTDRRLPMVLLVHGGPWARDAFGYNPYHQMLANRGYAVLSVNFRGSTGFGKSFLNAGNFEWAGKMHDDLIDAVDWAIASGIADPDRVAIMGGSYGGYATLVGLTMTPEVFAAGVDIVGPSNLNTLLASIPPYWAPLIAQFTSRVGDPNTDDGRRLLEERSPLNYADRIEDPLLIAQGANDPRVKQAESDQIVAAMQQHGIPVTYVVFPDEGHGFARPENSIAFNAVTEAFLAEHLGGRYEPIDGSLEGSSITVPAGAEHIPGLEVPRP